MNSAFKQILDRVFLLGAITAISSGSFAYEIDTHFYATYSMARYAGINHDVASVIASAAQWPDEMEMLGSPMIPELGLGTKMRRLFHFPCTPTTAENGAHSGKQTGGTLAEKAINKIASMLGDSDAADKYLDTLDTVCETMPADESAISFNMLFEGLKEGNLVKAATSIHTIEDSYAHAGTPSNLGHSMLGHHPDRPSDAPDKYERMVHSVMKAMVAIRMNLPASAIDTHFRDRNPKLNYLQSGDELAQNYLANPNVAKNYKDDQYNNPEFASVAIRYFISLAQKISSEGDYLIDPSFDLSAWMSRHSEMVSQINSGQNEQCVLPSQNPKGHPVTKVQCILVKVVEKLLSERDPMGNLIADKYRASSLLKTYAFSSLGDPYDKEIAVLIAKRSDLSSPTIGYASIPVLGERIQMQTMNEAVAINREIDRLIQERREVLASAFENMLTSQKAQLRDDVERAIVMVVRKMTAGYIPEKLDDYHKLEFENEGPLRFLESSLRVRNMRQTIHQIFGDYVRFVENSKVWSYPLARSNIQNPPLAQPDVLALPGEQEWSENPSGRLTTNIKYVTLNYNQIDMWIESSIRYMFPLETETFFPKGKCSVVSNVTEEINGKLVQLKPGIVFKSKKDVLREYFRVLLNPFEDGCNPQWTQFWKTQYKERLAQKIKIFLADFRTTHILPPAALDGFNKDDSIQDLFKSKRDDDTPLFRQFHYWGQLSVAQNIALSNSMKHRYELIRSGNGDDAPYVKNYESKNNH